MESFIDIEMQLAGGAGASPGRASQTTRWEETNGNSSNHVIVGEEGHQEMMQGNPLEATTGRPSASSSPFTSSNRNNNNNTPSSPFSQAAASVGGFIQKKATGNGGVNRSYQELREEEEEDTLNLLSTSTSTSSAMAASKALNHNNLENNVPSTSFSSGGGGKGYNRGGENDQDEGNGGSGRARTGTSTTSGTLVNNPNTHGDYRQKRLKVAIAFCLLLFIIQFIGGYISSSLALMADAFHMLSDVIGYLISLASIVLASSPITKRYPFGKKRLEVLGALASIALLWVLTLGLVIEAWERLEHPRDIDGKTMLFMAIGGVVVNGLLIGIFGHDMADGDEDDHTEGGGSIIKGMRVGSLDEESRPNLEEGFQNVQLEPQSTSGHGLNHLVNGGQQEEKGPFSDHHTKTDINMRAAMLHAIGDLLCSIGVFISALVIVYKPEWKWIDPLCTFAFAITAIFTTLSVLVDIFKVLMQATPAKFDVEIVKGQIMSQVKGVVSCNNIQCWALTQKDLVATVQLTTSVAAPYQISVIIQEVKEILERHGVSNSTVETQVHVHSLT